MAGPYILGLNQYTHSAAACLLDRNGEVVYALQKERISRKKHDGGDVAVLVEQMFETTGLGEKDLAWVVANNHLFHIAPFEKSLPFRVALHQWRPSYLDSHNLLPEVAKHELSHHLAHAWSVLPVAPFDHGVLVIMDGMGSPYREVREPGPAYTTDASLPNADGSGRSPATLQPFWGWREGESVYRFEGLRLELLWKRWIRENTPDFLYNYGFENMESLGAVYSRVSSHIFGDWNVCGKVMGLAPWHQVWNETDSPLTESEPILRGPLEELSVHWPFLKQLGQANQWEDRQARKTYAALAWKVQKDLEEVALDFLIRVRQKTGARNLALAGGVALNSSLNGRIVRECGYEQVFIPSYPGDEGIAVGCAHFGHHVLARPEAKARRIPLSPFLGNAYSDQEIEQALQEFASYLTWQRCDDPAVAAAEALVDEKVIGWFQGRSEFGPRALGARCILAHPGRRETIRYLNQEVKNRESFRPFAPAVLEEHAEEYFDGPTPSPFMSMTAKAKAQHRDKIQAVLHVDQTARLQTLSQQIHPRFRMLVQAFRDRSGVAMVLNTSFNRRGEPIVESPADALATFLDAGLDLLFLEGFLIQRRPFPQVDEWSKWTPCHRPEVTSSMTSTADGEPLQILLLAGGRTLEVSALELGVFEACQGEVPLSVLVEEFCAEFDESPDAVAGAVEKLFQLRVLSLKLAQSIGGNF
ncbi:MAG: carbamoyltransferase [Planctomycetota bacterium]|nr:MAG: carbamoyltransferase [Planctomycetota bacterium]